MELFFSLTLACFFFFFFTCLSSCCYFLVVNYIHTRLRLCVDFYEQENERERLCKSLVLIVLKASFFTSKYFTFQFLLLFFCVDINSLNFVKTKITPWQQFECITNKFMLNVICGNWKILNLNKFLYNRENHP